MNNQKKNHKNYSLNNLRPQTEVRKVIEPKKDISKNNYSTEDNNNNAHRISNPSFKFNIPFRNDVNVKNKFINKINLNKNNFVKKKRIVSKRVKKVKVKEGLYNLNDYIKFKDFHSNLIARLEKISPKSNNQNINYKKKCFNNINLNISNDNIIEKKRSKSNNKSRLRPSLLYNINFNKNVVIKRLDSRNKNNKRVPHLINIDLTKKEENEIKNNQKNIKNSPKKIKNNIHLNNKKKKKSNLSPKIKKIPSININLNEIVKEESLGNIKDLKKINNKKDIKDIKDKPNIEEIKELTNNKNEIFKSYAFFEHQNKEYRESMEDFYNFKNLSFDNFICFYFSIFDGHNGKQVSFYLKENFHKVLLNELKLTSFTNDYKQNNEKIILSIKKSFAIIDKNLIDNKNIKDDIGSTGTVIILYRDFYDTSKIILISANVGDSKGFIINKDNIKQITKDHNCSDVNEVERIKKEGGVVFQGRVFGTLILTRSLGDKEMKQYGVIAKPYCFSSLINENDLYVIIGSDGVWDVLPNENLFELSKENMNTDDFVKKIVMLSIDRGSTDNISCLVIKLN